MSGYKGGQFVMEVDLFFTRFNPFDRFLGHCFMGVVLFSALFYHDDKWLLPKL